jgi:hypothetical protein
MIIGKKISLLVLIILLNTVFINAQSTKNISTTFQNKTITDIINQISSDQKIKIYFKDTELPKDIISKEYKEKDINSILNDLLLGSNLKSVEYGGAFFIISKSPNESRNAVQDEITKAETLAEIQSKPIIIQGEQDKSGKNILTCILKDEESKEEIIGAYISLNGKFVGVSDEKGSINLTLNNGEQVISISYIGYQVMNLKFNVSGKAKYTVNMVKEAQVFEEVVISGMAAGTTMNETQSGINRIDIKALERIPTFLGERDVIKAVLLNPGVSSVGEGASGFNVRGGNVDQNLVIQDDAILFNSSHALGFFSTFNADMIKTATLHKGAFNAQYGGRLASVLDVQTKDGTDKFRLKGNINILSTTGTAEIPLFKGTSLLLSGRTTYSDFIFGLFKQPEIKNSGAGFYDLNAKLTIKTGKSTIALSGYVSDDDFIYNNEFGFDYRTKIAQGSIRTLFSDHVSNKLSFVWSEYTSNQSEFESQFASVFTSNIKYLKGHNKVTYNKGKLNIDGGITSTLYTVAPGAFTPIGTESLAIEERLDDEKGLESALYVSSDFSITKSVELLLGVRLNHFAALGPKTIYKFEDNILDPEFITGTETLDGIIRSSLIPEARASVKVKLSESLSFKTGYGRTSQFLSQIFNTDVPTPSSQWQMVNHIFDPGISDNISAGLFYTSKNGIYEISAEAYQRYLKNVYDYKDYADLFVNPHVETEILTGNGNSKGIEFSLKKNKGVVNGFVSYTYSQTKYKVDGINKGQWYLANYDQPHNVSVIFNYQPIEKITFTSNFTYRTGRPTTAPISSYVNFDGVLVPIYSERNALRIPDTHRLDLSANFGKTHNKAARLKSSWTFTIYNVYARKNPFSVFYGRAQKDIQVPQANRLAVIGTMFPSISFNLEFE